MRDVLAAALRAVDEVGRVAVARDDALQRDSRRSWRKLPASLPSLLSNTSSTEPLPIGLAAVASR